MVNVEKVENTNKNNKKGQVNKQNKKGERKEVAKLVDKKVDSKTENKEVKVEKVENKVSPFDKSVLKDSKAENKKSESSKIDSSNKVTTADSAKKEENKKAPVENQTKEIKIEKAKEDKPKQVTIEEVKEPFTRKTRLEHAPEPRDVSWFLRNEKKLDFDMAIQRGQVWNLDQKSDLIHSILYGFPIPQILARKNEDGTYSFLDGKQRVSSILGYVKGEYALSKKTESVYGYELAGKKYKDLTDEMQGYIIEEYINITVLKDITDEEVDKLFVKWNSGTALSNIELTRAMHSGLLHQLNRISELEFFADDIPLTASAKEKYKDQEIILQIAMLLEQGKENIKGFGSTQIKKYVSDMKEKDRVFSNELMATFEDISRYLNMSVSDFVNAELKVFKKVHIPIVFYTAIKAKEDKIKPMDFGNFIRKFLIADYNVESKYGQASQKSTPKKENVLIRIDEMSKAYEKFVKNIK